MVESPDRILTVLDSENWTAPLPGGVCLWNGYVCSGDQRSLLAYCEANAERLRDKYCQWVYDLGNALIDGRRLVDHLAIEKDFSYWWMTQLVEKSSLKSSAITDAIRLLALEEIVLDQKPGKIRLISADRRLHESIDDLSARLGIGYAWERISSERRLTWRERIRALPPSLKGGLSLVRHLCLRWPFRRMKKLPWFEGDRALFLCSYFFNIAPKPAAAGEFYSKYWEDLHGLIGRLGLTTNWMQIYYPHGAVPNARTAIELAERFNENGDKQGRHVLLDSYLSWRMVRRVLLRWLRLHCISWRLRKIKEAFRPQGSVVSLWPFMKSDWDASMRGPVAINNLIWIELFDAAASDLPLIKKGFYLCENQGWERALIHAWRKHGHGQLIAVPHSTRRFWDLRYVQDPRVYSVASAHPLPRPDLTAVNGKAAWEVFLAENHPSELMVECEALRFGYLDRFLRQAPKSRNPGSAMLEVLILGDYVPSATIRMLKLLEAAVSQIGDRVKFTLKPHPNFPVQPADYPSLNLRIVTDPLASILRDFDLAYSSNATSAAVDAYLAGLPVVVMLDGSQLNFSPLRGRSGARFVNTPGELVGALRTAGQGSIANPATSEFFFLDPKLPRWARLLEN